MTYALQTLLTLSLFSSPILPEELNNHPFVVAGCKANSGNIFLVLMLDGGKHSVIETINLKNKITVTRFASFEFSKRRTPLTVEFSSGVASENELAFYRDYLMKKPLVFSSKFDWIKSPKKTNCPVYKDPYN